jgi:hypothetical protein
MKQSKLPLVLIVITVFVLLQACGDDSPNNSESGPLFAVHVSDGDGNPLESVYVATVNRSQYLPRPAGPRLSTPTTQISFVIPEAGFCQLDIYDWPGKLVATPISGQLDAGVHSIQWDASTDLQGNRLMPGYYRYELTYQDDTESKWVVLETLDPTQSILGVTDTIGEFSTDSLSLFPGLIPNQPEVFLTDEFGNVTDTTNDFYMDSIVICIDDDTSDANGFVMFHRKLNDTENSFDLVLER